jgi:hypothetical protein
MKLIVGNNLDNKDLDYDKVSNDKTLGDSLPCFGCDKEILPNSKCISLPWTGKKYSTIVCLSCVNLIVKAIDQIQAIDGEYCLYCRNFSPMAVKNYPQGLLCFGCNTHRNRVILGVE